MIVNLRGMTFKFWHVVEDTGSGQWVLCKCVCGVEKRVKRHALKNNRSRSCGCQHNKVFGTASVKHELGTHPLYGIWKAMANRCLNPRNKHYKNYGGRGIKLCKRWWHTPKFFIADMGLKPSAKHSLDRIDNNKGYNPKNCRWSTKLGQACHRRNNVVVTFDGITLVLSEWAKKLGIPRGTLLYRLKRGWSVECTLTEPVHTQMRNSLTGKRWHKKPKSQPI